MSEPTGPTSTEGPRVVPIVLGALLVAAVIAAALAVERATTGDSDLPATLPGGYGAADLTIYAPGDAEAAERSAERQRAVLDSAEERLEDVLDAAVTVRAYQTGAFDGQVRITVIDAAAGPFAPNGPQPDPELLGVERGPFELVRAGDTICQRAWGNVVSEGKQVPDEDPAAVRCQLGAEGRTYWLSARGISVDDAVEMLESVRD